MSPGIHERLWSCYARGYDVLFHLQPYRQMMQDIFHELPNGQSARWLDAGCGTGNFMLSANGHSESKGNRENEHPYVVGVDFSAMMLRCAARKGLGGQLVRSRLDQPLPFPDAAFDAVTCVNVLYALPSPADTVSEFRRMLKVGGRVVFVNPKTSVSPLRIFAEHLRSLNGRRAWLAAFPLIPALIWVGLCNVYLLSGKRRRHWFFPSAQELMSMLAHMGFTNVNIRETYAEQAWLVSGMRR